MRFVKVVSALGLILALGSSAPVAAQTPFGAIEGVVRDGSGAVLPGATVEVTSPALIEGVRTMSSAADGGYRFLRLPVGTYAVKASLEGFGAVERRDVVINSGFTATIDVELQVSAMTEVVTVAGGSPVVDVRSTTNQTVLTSQAIEAVPSARNVFDMTKFIIGASTSAPDVGGSTSHLYTNIQIHGSRSNDRGYYRDGVRVAAYFGNGDAPRAYGSTGAQQEVNYQTAAIPASVSHGGIVINMVSKSGGNRLSGSLFASGSNDGLQSSNLTDELRTLGVQSTSGAKKAYDIDGSVGGPIQHDKIWFFGSARVLSFTSLLANQVGLDGRQAEDFIRRFEYFVKGTTQIDRNNKVSLSMSYDGSFRPFRREGATFVTDEAAGLNTSGRDPYNRVIVGSWTSTFRNDWIFEAGWGHTRVGARTTFRPESTDFARLDLVTNTLTGAGIRIREDATIRDDYTASATHVRQWFGSHEIKLGTQGDFGRFDDLAFNRGDIVLNYRNGVPDSVDLVNTPVMSTTSIKEFGLYLQDSWQLNRRLTVNFGVRYDYFNVVIPEQQAPAGAWVPERRFDRIPVVTWNDVAPRVGVAYDLFGTGRTVLKGSVSKYLGVEAAGVGQDVNPMFRSTNRCAWTDRNGDTFADSTELSACQGFSGGLTTTIDPGLRRPFNREYSAGVQHQLADNLGLTVMYFRRENRDNRGSANLAVPTDSYIPLVISNPIDGTPLTIFNQNPATTGRQQNLLTNSDKLDNDYNGVEFAVQRRFSRQAYLLAGYHYGKNIGRVTSGDLNDPNLDIFGIGAVRDDEPHMFKLSGSYLLPGSISMSGFLSARSGHPRARQLNVGRALVPTLTRASQTVRVERNDDERYPSVTLLDLRFGRPFTRGGLRVEPFADVYNLFNANTILTDVTTIGSSLGRVSSTINPRLIRLGAKLEF